MTEILDFAAHIIYTTALLICRLSGLAFYYRIAGRHPKLRWCIRGAAVFMIIAYLPQLLLIVFHCLPVTGLWPYSFQPSADSEKCLEWGVVYVTNTVISLVCDGILLAIPAAILKLLKVSLRRKLLLACVLMPGLLVIALSTTRMYLVIDGQWQPDESWVYDPFLAIEVSEVGSTLIALSIPALKPFFGAVFDFLDRNREQEDEFWVPPRTVGTSQLPSDCMVVGFHEGTNRSGQSVPGAAFRDWEQHSLAPRHGMGQTFDRAEKENSAIRLGRVGGVLPSVSSDGRQDSDPSVRSDISQWPMIQYQREYTVTHEGRG